jgi:hypothetical protein
MVRDHEPRDNADSNRSYSSRLLQHAHNSFSNAALLCVQDFPSALSNGTLAREKKLG